MRALFKFCAFSQDSSVPTSTPDLALTKISAASAAAKASFTAPVKSK
jgi:hypothetical protein